MKQSIKIIIFTLLLASLITPISYGANLELQTIRNTYNRLEKSLILGADSSLLVGTLTKNYFGFPMKSVGISPFLGLDIRRFTNTPSLREVEDTAAWILQRNPDISLDELRREIHKQAHPRVFRYFQYGTEALIVPKIGTGMLVPFSRDINNQAYFDLGIYFPGVINIGFLISF